MSILNKSSGKTESLKKIDCGFILNITNTVMFFLYSWGTDPMDIQIFIPKSAVARPNLNAVVFRYTGYAF